MSEKTLINKISKTSASVAKSFFGFGPGGVIDAEIISPQNYRSGGTPLGNNGWIFDGLGPGLDVHFSYNGLSDVVEAYECCAPVYSIVNKQAYCFVNGKTFVNDTTKKKESTTNYAKKIKALLTKPNALQNGKQFEAQAVIYLRLFGYCIILPIKPVGFPNEDATALWIIPPYMCELTYAKQTFYNLKKGFISSIKVTYGSEISVLNPEDVIILRDITPGFDTLFIPNSPIKPIQQNISNLLGIYNSKGMLINYRGALGILTPELDPNGTLALPVDEKEDLQNSFLRYGLKSNQWKFIISNSALKWQQMGIPYRDLMLTEWGEDDTMVICDALNYPFKLLSNSKSSSMNGTETAAFQKQLYQDFIIPFAEMIYEQISEAFNADKNGCVIEKDYSHITVLQDDMIAAGRALFYMNQGCQIQWFNNIITANQWLRLTEQDSIPDGDKYYDDWLKEGKVFGSAKQPQPLAGDNIDSNSNSNNQP